MKKTKREEKPDLYVCPSLNVRTFLENLPSTLLSSSISHEDILITVGKEITNSSVFLLKRVLHTLS